MTWLADIGAEAERLELEACLNISGIGGGGGILDKEVCSRRSPCAGFEGSPLEEEEDEEDCDGTTVAPFAPRGIIEAMP